MAIALSGKAMIDFGATPSYDAPAVRVTATGATRGGLAEAWVLHESTPDHSLDEVLLAPIEARAQILNSATPDTIEIRAWSKIALTGKYRVGWVVYDALNVFKGFVQHRFYNLSDSVYTLNSNAAALIGPILGAMPNWTIGWWVLFGPDDAMGIVGQENSAAPLVMIKGAGTDPHISMWFASGSMHGECVNAASVSFPPTWGTGYTRNITKQNWLFLHMTYNDTGDGNHVRLHANGVERLRSDPYPTGDWGPMTSITWTNFKGRLASPFVANAALTPTQVATILAEGPRYDLRNISAVRHWWPGDGDSTAPGATVTDRGAAGTCNLQADFGNVQEEP